MLRFSDPTLNTGSGELCRLDFVPPGPGSSGGIEFTISTGLTRSFNGYLRSGTTSTSPGVVYKTGDGTVEVAHVRAATLELQGGTFKITSTSGGGGSLDIVGDSSGTSRVNTLSIAGGSSPTGKLDLRNNDLIVDYTGSSPMGNPSSGSQTIAQWIKNAYTSGTWGGTGITSSQANAGTYALGYAEASSALGISGSGTAPWSGQIVDATTVLVGFTYYGDSTLDGVVNIADFALLSANYSTSGRVWYDGDYNYDGSVNIGDFGLLAGNFNAQPDLMQRGGLPPLAELFIAMLDFPVIYWEAHDRPDIWWRFEQFQKMNLGPIPPRPLNRSLPEVSAVAMLLSCAAAAMRRRRPR